MGSALNFCKSISGKFGRSIETKIDFAHFAWVSEIRLIKLVVWIHTSTNGQFIDKINISWNFCSNGNFDIQQPGVLHVGLSSTNL